MRGPGWNFFMLGQQWDPHAVVSQSNMDLPLWLFGIPTKTPYGAITIGHMVVGSLAILGYFAAFITLPYVYLKKKGSETLAKLGLPRYLVTAALGALMMSLVVKIALRLAFNVKSVLVPPFASF